MAKPRKPKNRPLPPNLYVNSVDYYYYRNPNSKKVKGLGKDKALAIQEARAANAVLATLRPSSLAEWVAGKTNYKLSEWLPTYRELWYSRSAKPPAANTVSACDLNLKKIAQWDMACMAIGDITTAHVAARLQAESENSGPMASIQLRSRLSDVFRMAETQGLIPQGCNPVKATYMASYEVKRERLTLEQYRAIHALAPVPMRRAMDLALLTGQRRDDLTGMKFDDCRNGYLHVVQGKSGGTTRLQLDLGIGLAVLGMTIEQAVDNCRDKTASDYLIHHIETRGRARRGAPLTNNGVTGMFLDARKAAGIVAEQGRTPPSFHEIRSLAQRLYREQYGAEFAQILLGHKNAATTAKYNDLRGQGWQRIAAP